MSNALETQPVEIFRAGDYGAKGVFTTADLDRVAAAYKPSDHEAPVVVGHPKTVDPAFGWVKSLKREGVRLMAQFGQVQPEFAEMVEAGRFKKRSASFYRDPVTKAVTGLRHVGFLGAQPPHVKGLSDVAFEDEGREVTEVDFEESEMADDNKALENSLFERLKALILPKPAAEAATTSFSEAQLKTAIDEAVKTERDAMQKLIADFSEGAKKAATLASKSRAADAIAKLKREGKWVPAFDKAHLSIVFEELAKSDETVEFEEAGAKVVVAPLDALANVMEALPKIVPPGTLYAGQKPGSAADPGASQVNTNGRAPVDPNSSALDLAVKDAMKGDSKLTYGEALSRVSAEKPELTKPGGATAGAA